MVRVLGSMGFRFRVSEICYVRDPATSAKMCVLKFSEWGVV